MTVKEEIDDLIARWPSRVNALMLSPAYWGAFCEAVGVAPDRACFRYREPARARPAGVLVLPSWEH